ncbi:hypothetical protein [Chelatococcus sp. YT9]|uniref:hypothetical protein n=1 Tax=Chelatococcus sp. YT9 TaxID=2835635 RepID=UPI001BCDC344|nr:hypothetical protein [Chelatococcus sp. YT9]MBS7701535.1 hypothetical protein [Chelatococcus sp. YT9]
MYIYSHFSERPAEYDHMKAVIYWSSKLQEEAKNSPDQYYSSLVHTFGKNALAPTDWSSLNADEHLAAVENAMLTMLQLQDAWLQQFTPPKRLSPRNYPTILGYVDGKQEHVPPVMRSVIRIGLAGKSSFTTWLRSDGINAWQTLSKGGKFTQKPLNRDDIAKVQIEAATYSVNSWRRGKLGLDYSIIHDASKS